MSDEARPGTDRSHYSYQHYSDRGVAERFDELRFGGPIGQYLLASQQRLLLAALNLPGDRRVLDVGTGTGRAAIALAKSGATVVGIDASREMLEVARDRAASSQVAVEFLEGDAHDLAFPDRTFDASVSLRVLMHTPDWARCIRELCRVARWRVVVDFPALGSFAALESAARRLGERLGHQSEAYRVLAERDVRAAFASHGFHTVSAHRQFVLPIAFHKAMGSRALTLGIEGSLAAVGLLRLFGSPVTMVAER